MGHFLATTKIQQTEVVVPAAISMIRTYPNAYTSEASVKGSSSSSCVCRTRRLRMISGAR
jgi:hypothetical protein